MPLFLNEADVRQLLTMPLAIEAVEEAHRELSLANAVDVPRQRTRLPKTALHILQVLCRGAMPSVTRPTPATVQVSVFWSTFSACRAGCCVLCSKPICWE